MHRILIVFLAGLISLSAVGSFGALPAPDRAVAAVHDDHDDDDDKGEDHNGHDDDDDSGRGRGRGGDDDDGTPSPAAQTGAATGTLEVHMAGEQFQPSTLTIQAGQTVTFINDDDDEHTATGTDFDTGEMNPGESVTVTFDQPGTFTFICQFHADMQAEIVVLAAGDATPQATPEASPAADAGPASATQTVEIEIQNFEFSPATLTVPPGTTVVWTNTSPTPHTVTGDFADSGIMETDGTFEWTFTDPGTYAYICALHPAMEAQIIVDPNAPPVGG
jgi:plastocyanin